VTNYELLIIGCDPTTAEWVLAGRAARSVREQEGDRVIPRSRSVAVTFENGSAFLVWQSQKRQTVKKVE